MRFCVGIFGNRTNGVELLLRQIGVPFEFASGQVSPESYSVIIAEDVSEPSSVAVLRKYLQEGGGVLCSGRTYSMLTGKQGTKKFIRWLRENPQDSIFNGIGFVDLCMECHVPDGATILYTNEGVPSALSGKNGNGYVLALPFDLSAVLSDERTMAKSFYANRSRLPFETVSLIARSGIRNIITRALEILHHQRGLPFLHSWYYPKSNANLFSFRIDTDYANLDDLESLYGLLQKHQIQATWFVDVKSQEHILSFFKKIQTEGQEIGVHCYEHTTFDDYEKNFENIDKAKQRLTEAGIQPAGFAAPFGKWNRNLSRAVSKLGFEYSSEFSYDYDNFPGYPVVEETFEPALQIPIHPISIGSLRRQGFSQSEMIAYFDNAVRDKIDRCEPLFFYHHPKNHHHEVLEHLFQVVHQHQLQNMTMAEFARWWKIRAAVRFSAVLKEGNIYIKDRMPADNIALRISRDSNTESIVSPQSVINLDTVVWKKKPSATLPPDIRRIRKFNPWIPVNRIENYVHSLLTRTV